MARRGKKAVATAAATAATVTADNEPNDIPDETKKTKIAKNVKQSKQDENIVNESANKDGDDVSVKANSKSKKATATKKTAKQIKQIEQNGGSHDDGEVLQAKAETKPKRAATKKNAIHQQEQDVDALDSERNDETKTGSPEKSKKRGAKGKPVKEEPAKEMDTKASNGRSKRVKPVPVEEEKEEEIKNEPGPSNTKNKSTKAKGKLTKKVDDLKNDDVVEKVTETKGKRGVKKEKPPVEPTETTKSTKSKKADTAKTKPSKYKKQSEPPTDQVDNTEPKNGDGSSTSRKRQAIKSEPSIPGKKVKKENADSSTTVKSPEPKANGESRKRKAETKAAADSTTNEGDDELVTKRKKTTKKEDKNEPKSKMNNTSTDYTKINFDSEKEYGMKIVSWNVAGLRALINKDGFDYFDFEKPDIICLQEIKCIEEEVPDQAKLKGYHPYWCSMPGGRGGVAILSKQMPYNVEKNIGDEEMDEEGRIITAEYAKFFLVCVYVPNAGRKLINLDRRLRWNKMFEDHLTELKAKKPVIICGDMNVAHEEIDLANPKSNTKNAGFTKEERDGMTHLLGLGFVDTFRELYPKEVKAYTFWTYMGGARAKNVGWRLDYSLVSENLKAKVVDSFMRPQILGSDHCPIVLLLNI